MGRVMGWEIGWVVMKPEPEEVLRRVAGIFGFRLRDFVLFWKIRCSRSVQRLVAILRK